MQRLPRPAPGVVAQEVEEGLLLLRDTGDYMLLNRTGALVWEALLSTAGWEELTRRLQETPGAPKPEECHEQASNLLDRLAEAGFLEEPA
ncbi:MAG TPA: PqqD family protein [Bacteroidetes bacterium]|nr:PqqD family protein [Bacteroidota bacterium]